MVQKQKQGLEDEQQMEIGLEEESAVPNRTSSVASDVATVLEDMSPAPSTVDCAAEQPAVAAADSARTTAARGLASLLPEAVQARAKAAAARAADTAGNTTSSGTADGTTRPAAVEDIADVTTKRGLAGLLAGLSEGAAAEAAGAPAHKKPKML
jgi:hypothetical protein